VNASSESSIDMPPPFENMTRSIVRPSRMKHVQLVDIAELFGVSKQRAHQLAGKDGFPAPVGEDGRGRLRDRREVTSWAQVWRREKS
jgi:hypothetical protein